MSESAPSSNANAFFVAATEAQTKITDAAKAPPSAIDITYAGLAGNKPNQFGNTAYVWQAEDFVPYDTTPDGKQTIDDDDRGGTVSVELGVQNKPYIVAYAVGNDPKSICSYGTIGTDGKLRDVFSTSVSLLGDVTTEIARIQYRVPEGAQPASWKHTLALWEGSAPSYTKVPVKSYDIPNDRDNDVVSIRYKFLANQTYTVAYLAGTGAGKNTTQIAAYVRFQTKS